MTLSPQSNLRITRFGWWNFLHLFENVYPTGRTTQASSKNEEKFLKSKKLKIMYYSIKRIRCIVSHQNQKEKHASTQTNPPTPRKNKIQPTPSFTRPQTSTSLHKTSSSPISHFFVANFLTFFNGLPGCGGGIRDRSLLVETLNRSI